MKKALLASTALVLVSAEAFAGGLRGSYASIEGGATWFHPELLAQTTTFVSAPSTANEYQAEFATGWAVFGSVGYAFDSGVRTELELGYRFNELNRLFNTSGSTMPDGGEFSSFTILANALYDIPVGKVVTLTVGAGLGVEQAKLEVDDLGFSDDAWQVAYQALVGVNYIIGDRTSLFLNYRYLHTETPDYSVLVDEVTGESQFTTFLADLNRHTVTVGLRYGFEGRKAR